MRVKGRQAVGAKVGHALGMVCCVCKVVPGSRNAQGK